MASVSDDPVGVASASDVPVSIATTSDDSDNMSSSSDESVMEPCHICGKSHQVKRMKKGKVLKPRHIKAMVARVLVHAQRDPILRQYMQDGQWDEANGKITCADMQAMRNIKEFKRKQFEIRRERLALKRRVLEEILTWTPMPRRPTGSA